MIEINSEKFKQDYIILTYDKLAEKYGISRSSVREIVKQLGLSKKRGVKKKIIVKENQNEKIVITINISFRNG